MAKAKSARPEWRASVSRVRHSVRTSGLPSSGAAAASQPPSASARTRLRQASSTEPWSWPRASLAPAQASSSRASVRCRSSKNGHERKLASGISVSLELGYLFGHERFVGALEVPGLHADRLRLGLRFDSGIDAQVP